METVRVGIREFRDNLASYLLEGSAPVAVTRHGDTVGYFIPTRRRPTEEQMEAFRKRAEEWQKSLDVAGIDDQQIEVIMDDFKKWRKTQVR